jgi:hypothetical protein
LQRSVGVVLVFLDVERLQKTDDHVGGEDPQDEGGKYDGTPLITYGHRCPTYAASERIPDLRQSHSFLPLVHVDVVRRSTWSVYVQSCQAIGDVAWNAHQDTLSMALPS